MILRIVKKQLVSVQPKALIYGIASIELNHDFGIKMASSRVEVFILVIIREEEDFMTLGGWGQGGGYHH